MQLEFILLLLSIIFAFNLKSDWFTELLKLFRIKAIASVCRPLSAWIKWGDYSSFLVVGFKNKRWKVCFPAPTTQINPWPWRSWAVWPRSPELVWGSCDLNADFSFLEELFSSYFTWTCQRDVGLSQGKQRLQRLQAELGLNSLSLLRPRSCEDPFCSSPLLGFNKHPEPPVCLLWK